MRRPISSLALAAAVVGSLILGASTATAAPPQITLTTFSITTDSVTLEADIDPGGKASLYHFEYGLAPCSANPCTSVPSPKEGEVSPKDVPEGEKVARVKAEVNGLTPATTYHFRVVVKNSEGKVEGPDRTFTTYQPEHVFGPCPNDELRGGHPLPDCRAYEQASPTDKNSQDVTGTYPTAKASIDGDAVIYATSSPIPGATGAQEIPLYVSRREGGEWSTQGLLPPQSYGDRASIAGWTPDFAQVFDRAILFGEPDTIGFFSRSSADGSLFPIVPYADMGSETPYHYAGSSADGSKVFFEVISKSPAAQLTPEAALGEDNLYVFDHETETTHLVGVLPSSECESTPPCAPPGGSFAGPYDWANNDPTKGGAERNYYLREQRPISEDGSKSYFSAGDTGQLYLRHNPTGPGASTVHVSASEKTDGNGEDGRDIAGTKPAAFMAASADGKVALLASSEKLTNDATTGPEPIHPPAIARAETDGDPVEIDFLPVIPKNAFGVALDAEHVYWTDPKGGTIGRANISAPHEPDPDFIDEEVGDPQYIAVDTGHVYWTNTEPLDEKGNPEDGKGTIGRANISGGEVDEDFITGASNPRGIAVGGEFLYWANAGNEGAVETRAIGQAKLGASGAEEVDQEFISLKSVLEGSKLTPEGLVVNASNIYATVNDNVELGYVFRWDLNGGNEKLFFDQQFTSLRGIALDDEYTYWAREDANTIGRAKLDFSDPEREWIKDAGHPGGIAVDSGHLYWSANQELQPNPGNDLYRYDSEAPAGERLTDLVVHKGEPNGADVRGVLGTSEDLSRVYFAANGDLDGPGPATPGNCVGEQVDTEKGTCNLYLLDGEAITFIAPVQAGTVAVPPNWSPTTSVSGGFSFFHKSSQVSADGSTLIFASELSLGPYQHDAVAQLYRYRVGEGLDCVSCNPTGAAPVGEASVIQPPLMTPPRPASVLSRNLSADGNRVIFESLDALVGTDVNGIGGCPGVGTSLQGFRACQDVYEWEASGTGSCKSEAQNGGCLYLLSSGQSSYPSFFIDASADGSHAFIITGSPLVGQDQDELLDVYDLSIGGGIASQNEPPAPICEAQACRGPIPPPPSFQSPATPSFQGPGNAKEKRRPPCPKGKRRVRAKGKSRCVARKGRKPSAKGKNTRRGVSR